MRLFVLLSRVPFPLEKGDRLRAYHQLRLLKETHHVMLCCLTDEAITDAQHDALEQISSEYKIVKLNKAIIALKMARGLFSRKPFQVLYFHQARAHRKIANYIEDFKPDHIYCQLIRTTEYVKRIFDIPKTLDYMDALNMGMNRRVRDAAWYKKDLIRLEGQRLQDYENLIYDYFDQHTIISSQDKELIIHPQRDSITVVPNGVDSVFFSPRKTEEHYDIVFTGNMSYPPNVAASELLVNEIIPLIEAKCGIQKVLLAGVDPINRVKQLAGPNVTVSGWMDDIREAYADGKIFVAPLNIGTGLQNKLLEAMSMGKACVTSTLVNNALGAKDGQDLYECRHVEEFAARVIELLESRELRLKMGESARHYVQSNFSWSATTDKLSELFLREK